MNTMKGIFLLLVTSLTISSVLTAGLPDHIKEEILAHKVDVNRIIDYVLHGAGHHKMYKQLAEFTDDHGPRLGGTDGLEEAINYTLDALKNEGFQNVHGEDVPFAKWVRGEGMCLMTAPRERKIEVLASGTSVGTPAEGISADVIVVRSFDELDDRQAEVPGKIVVYNQPWTNYGQSSQYRREGASKAANYNAVAALVRSATPFSVNSPHTGSQTYAANVTHIPVGCITVEDAEMMQRLHNRGKTVTLKLTLTCRTEEGTAFSRNTVAEYKGHKYPDQFVIIGGHMDSWDVGYGPMDDGAGVVMSWQVLRILQELDLVPKRTIRTVFWTLEEVGLYGADAYYEAHMSEHDNISMIMESDMGTFRPLGVGFTGIDLARAIVQEIANLLTPINATGVGQSGGSADIGKWDDIGVPVGNLWNDNKDYFIYHHSNGDSMTMEDPDQLDQCTIVWTVVTYVLANMEDMLPRTGIYEPEPTAGIAIKVAAGVKLITASALFCLTIRRFFFIV